MVQKPLKQQNQVAYFAGGCFWCMQPAFVKHSGVVSTTVGYMQGHVENPTYEQVCTGKTGHTEAIKIEYDPELTNYREMLQLFWRQIDPSTTDQQFCDVGSQYRTGIYFVDAAQETLARASKAYLEDQEMFAQIATEIEPAAAFFAAEDKHQHFYEKNPNHYRCYREASGRDEFIASMWVQFSFSDY